MPLKLRVIFYRFSEEPIPSRWLPGRFLSARLFRHTPEAGCEKRPGGGG